MEMTLLLLFSPFSLPAGKRHLLFFLPVLFPPPRPKEVKAPRLLFAEVRKKFLFSPFLSGSDEKKFAPPPPLFFPGVEDDGLLPLPSSLRTKKERHRPLSPLLPVRTGPSPPLSPLPFLLTYTGSATMMMTSPFPPLKVKREGRPQLPSAPFLPPFYLSKTG